jgi:hypothetical protein
MVHHRERLLDRQVGDEIEEPIVVEDDERIGAIAQPLDTRAGVAHAAAFRPERRRGHGDHDTAGGLRELRHERRDSRARPAAETDRDERQIRVAYLIPQLLFREFRTSLANVRAPSGAHPTGHPAANQHLPVRLDGIQMHGIRVYDDGPGAVNANPVETVNGIASRAPASDYKDARPRGRERIEERLVPRTLCGLEAHPWSHPERPAVKATSAARLRGRASRPSG